MVDQVLDDAPEAESFIMESGDAARGVAFDKSGEVAQARRGISLKFGTGVSIDRYSPRGA